MTSFLPEPAHFHDPYILNGHDRSSFVLNRSLSPDSRAAKVEYPLFFPLTLVKYRNMSDTYLRRLAMQAK
jgi:hypothetical protein